MNAFFRKHCPNVGSSTSLPAIALTEQLKNEQEALEDFEKDLATIPGIVEEILRALQAEEHEVEQVQRVEAIHQVAAKETTGLM